MEIDRSRPSEVAAEIIECLSREGMDWILQFIKKIMGTDSIPGRVFVSIFKQERD